MPAIPPFRTGRPATLARNGMVATPHYLASEAGIGVLAAGGNALDAAIAANAVLCVAYPHMAGLGGDLFMLIWPRAADVPSPSTPAGARPPVPPSTSTAKEVTRRSRRVARWRPLPFPGR